MADRGDFCSIQFVAQERTLLGSGLQMPVSVGSGSGEGRPGPRPGSVLAHSVLTGAGPGQEAHQLVSLVTPGPSRNRVKSLDMMESLNHGFSIFDKPVMLQFARGVTETRALSPSSSSWRSRPRSRRRGPASAPPARWSGEAGWAAVRTEVRFYSVRENV